MAGTIPTGSIALDIALDGGLPRGRIVELYGTEGCGKTTLSMHILAEAQRLRDMAVLVDAEHSLDPTYAESIGVDTASLLVVRPTNAEQAMAAACEIARIGGGSVVVVDSLAALIPRVETTGESGRSGYGHAKGLRRLSDALRESDVTVLFTNQLRTRPGSGVEYTAGGRALKAHAAIRMDMRRIESIKGGIGCRSLVRVVKNRFAPPFTKAELDIRYGIGISREDALIDVGVELSLVERSGVWYTYCGQRLGQGKENARIFLCENPDIASAIEKLIRSQLFCVC